MRLRYNVNSITTHSRYRDNRPHLYEALSYVWGSPNKSASASINGWDLRVTANLHSTLLRLRDRFFERILWADSICINQEDEKEKESQIQFMTKIYRPADRVIVYLGETASDSDQAMEVLHAAAGDDSTDVEVSERSQEVILKLLGRPWFRRMWVCICSNIPTDVTKADSGTSIGCRGSKDPHYLRLFADEWTCLLFRCQ